MRTASLTLSILLTTFAALPASPALAKAANTAPRAWPMTSAVRMFCAKNRPSTAAMVGLVFWRMSSSVSVISLRQRESGQSAGQRMVPWLRVAGVAWAVSMTP